MLRNPRRQLAQVLDIAIQICPSRSRDSIRYNLQGNRHEGQDPRLVAHTSRLDRELFQKGNVKVVKVLVQSEEVSTRARGQFDANREPILVVFMVERLDRGVDNATWVVCMAIVVIVCVVVVRSSRAQWSRCSAGRILFDGQAERGLGKWCISK